MQEEKLAMQQRGNVFIHNDYFDTCCCIPGEETDDKVEVVAACNILLSACKLDERTQLFVEHVLADEQ